MTVATHPQNIGIQAIEVYFPKKFVDQSELEKHDGVSSGKYTIGLGQEKMSFCDDREDIVSICLTVVQQFMQKYNVDYKQIGRLEVGTETIIDKSKSTKSFLMSLFAESGNHSVEGIDTTNACYGGTSALFNACQWMDSKAWDGRLALVVAGDIAVYASGNAQFPTVDGPLSVISYIRALDYAYLDYLKKLENAGVESPSLDSVDYLVFHSPYTKQVVKAFGRILFNDFLRNPTAPQYAEIYTQFSEETLESSYNNKLLEKAFINLSKSVFTAKTNTSLLAARNIGNMYTGSVFFGLASLISSVPSSELQGKRIALFSYGSGCAASIYSFKVVGDVSDIASKLDLVARLNDRICVTPSQFENIMSLRESTHNNAEYSPTGSVDELFPGTYHLTSIDSMYRRKYELS
ncbi:hypothetical protein BB561_004784 [Smittium simulii]|uniref:Hydroxymethylglutaryl-coenzyme A synthase C-terminal domain-containing protein n=1 Tax=Smittium simulii TaxID=133385 RepID=A0A2T9YEA2_9FUNG|nr:hypothetical protein BB561_004784 [Smittium simulii]